jgi:hypothetical protein
VSEHLSDEELARFLRESAEGSAAQQVPKEPSARARMVTARLREQDARGEMPPGWRTVTDLGPYRNRAARRRRVKAALAGLVVFALAVLALNPSLLPGYPWGDDAGTGSDAARVLPAETAAPTGAPGAVRGKPTLQDPFAGSPAASWQEGAASIVMPPAEATGVFSKQQVERALEQTRTLLVDANITPASLRGAQPKAALGVLDPRQPELLDDLRATLRHPGEKNNPLLLFSRFDPEETRVVGDRVRVRGRTTVEEGERGAVAITADYTFVYPVTRAAEGSTEVTRAVVRRVLKLEVPDPERIVATPGKLMITRYDSEWSNVGCGVTDGWAHPEFPSDRREAAPSDGATVDPYDRSGAVGAGGECGVLSRI